MVVAIVYWILLQLTTWFQATYKDSRHLLWKRFQLAESWLLSLRNPVSKPCSPSTVPASNPTPSVDLPPSWKQLSSCKHLVILDQDHHLLMNSPLLRPRSLSPWRLIYSSPEKLQARDTNGPSR
ncbi:hypothetical protein ATANTOWER_020486 [Ataeniobius toweri]|uniref:ATP synthase F0 subunit 8 n=1 Tax=Ataeniobius toweri TaxID=208326 RepID=A0ABU7BTN5_9TELE|nr:hypothetical protein [Ataeniobius toweri]